MNTVIIECQSRKTAIKRCKAENGWTPAAVRLVDSGKGANIKAWMCFMYSEDAVIWDNQQ